MSSEYQYISVVSPPTTAGTLAITLDTNLISSSDLYQGNPTYTGIPETLNYPASASFVLLVSGITGAETEIELSSKIYNQLGTYIKQQNLQYQGSLAYAEEVYAATFQTTNSDHCTCVWSQALFTIGVSGNTIGAIIQVDKSPNLITIADALDLGVTVGFDWQTDAGVSLTNAQIARNCLIASSFLTNRLRNNIVISTYAKELRGNDTNSIKLSPYPVLDFDQPRIRRKNITDIYNLPQWGKFAYGIMGSKRQSLQFRFHEVHIDHREPFSYQNLVYLTFLSGHNHIPEEVKMAVVELTRYKMYYRDGLRSMKAGDNMFSWDKDTRLNAILIPIMNYKMRP